MVRANAAPLRFVIGVVSLWIGGRCIALIPYGDAMTSAAGGISHPVGSIAAQPLPHEPLTSSMDALLSSARRRRSTTAAVHRPGRSGAISRPRGRDGKLLWREPAEYAAFGEALTARGPDPISGPRFDRSPAPFIPVAAPATISRWTADAYLFVRSDGGRPALAAGGQLGASQVAARITYRLNPRLALAARTYAALDRARESEGAIGIDWHPLPRAALRLTVERRVDIGGAGRNAWSAYAAGGFYRGGLPGAVEADGYAQAGIVGASRRDLFVDGALRLARPVALDSRHMLRIGIAAWGASQPGAARLDIGPRAALGLPLGNGTLTASIDYRARLAGDARPGSGPAFTLSTDF